MLSRGAEAVRLCINLRTVEGIVEYLAGVGWPGSEADVLGVLEPIAGLVDYVCLDIDVGETVHRKIGLECYFDGIKQPRTEPRWGVFLDSLVRDGLCTADKRDALLSYSGLRRRERGGYTLAESAAPSLASARRALTEHVHTNTPPRKARVPAGRGAGGQGIPGSKPPLAHARAPGLRP